MFFYNKKVLFFVVMALFLGCEPENLEKYSQFSNGALVSLEQVDLEHDVNLTTNVTDWRNEIIYQVIIDRFADGDPNNNFNVNKDSPAQFHGGDYQGLIDHIWYLKELGVTTIWISPVVQNVENDAGFASYHGYWTQNFLKVNPHFGDLAKLREMVDILHENGFKVILDIVVNHIGQLFFYDINKNGVPDEAMYGCGTMLKWFPEGECKSGFYHLTEYDPDFDPDGIKSWTSLGPSGPAPIIWLHDPVYNHMPIMPVEFQNPSWYNRKGRVIAWDQPNPQCFIKCFQYGPDNPNYQSVGQCIDKCNASSFSCEMLRLQEQKGDFPGGLKDLDTTIPDVRKALAKVFKYWIKVGDFDGFRIDTLKHVEGDFWAYFCPEMRKYAKAHGKEKFLMFGEAFDGNDDLIGGYTKEADFSVNYCENRDGTYSELRGGTLDSVFYFTQKYWVFDGVFKYGAPTRTIENLFKFRLTDDPFQNHYGTTPHENGIGIPPYKALVNFIENHDIPRFLFDLPDTTAQRQAFAFLLTEDGIPCIYYGSEQEFDGGNDPSNREDMVFNTENPTFKVVKRLISIRKKYDALRLGDLVIRWSTEHTGDEEDAGIFAFERLCGAGEVKNGITVSQWATCSGPDVLVVFNVNAFHPSRTTSNGVLMSVSFPPGTELVDVWQKDSPEVFTVDENSKLIVEVPPRGFRILVPKQ